MKSILFFIICISATICGGAVSATDGRLVSCRSCSLKALLPYGPSWSLLSAVCWGLVPSCSSPWLLSPAFFQHSSSSRSWFYLVRCSTTAARVYNCLSRAVSAWFFSGRVIDYHWANEYHTTLHLVSGNMAVTISIPIDDDNWWCQKIVIKSHSPHVFLTKPTQQRRGRPYREYQCGTSQIPSEG